MNEELLRQRVLNFLEVFYAGDLDVALDRCTDDVAFFSNAPIDILPHMGVHRGKAELRGMWETIYARYSYSPADIRRDHRFVDVLSLSPRGHRVVDLTRFHDTCPI